MNTLRILSALPFALGAAFLSGCYSYVPVERPAPGSTVRISVPVRSAVSRPNAAPETLSMEGTVLSAADSIFLEVESRREIGAFREYREVDTLRVAAADLSSLENRVFSRGKTIGLSLAIAGVTAVLAATAFGLGGGSTGDDGPGNGGTPASRIVRPIFSALLEAIGR